MFIFFFFQQSYFFDNIFIWVLNYNFWHNSKQFAKNCDTKNGIILQKNILPNPITINN